MPVHGPVVAGLQTSYCLIRSLRTWAGTASFSPSGLGRKSTSAAAQRSSCFGSTLSTICDSNAYDPPAKATVGNQSAESPLKPAPIKYIWSNSDEAAVVGVFHALGQTIPTCQSSKSSVAVTTAPNCNSLQRRTALIELDSAVSRGHLSQALEWYVQVRSGSCFTQMTNQRYHALTRLCLLRLRQRVRVARYRGLLLILCWDWLHCMGIAIAGPWADLTATDADCSLAMTSTPVVVASLIIYPFNLDMIFRICHAVDAYDHSAHLIQALLLRGRIPKLAHIRSVLRWAQRCNNAGVVLTLLHTMDHVQYELNPRVYDLAVDALLHMGQVDHAWEVWQTWVDQGRQVTTYCLNQLLRGLAYHKEQYRERILDIYFNLPTLNLSLGKLEFHAVLRALGAAGCHEVLVDAFEEMQTERIAPDLATCGILANAMVNTGRLDLLPSVHALARRVNRQWDVALYIDFICGYSHRGNVAQCYRLYGELLKQGNPIPAVGYNRLMLAFGKLGRARTALALFFRIPWPARTEEEGLNIAHVGSAIHICLTNHQYGTIKKVLARYQQAQLPPSVPLLNHLTRYWLATGDLQRALRVLDTMEAAGLQPDLSTFHTLVTGMCRLGQLNLALFYVYRMRDYGISYHDDIIVPILQAFMHSTRVKEMTCFLGHLQEHLERPGLELCALLFEIGHQWDLGDVLTWLGQTVSPTRAGKSVSMHFWGLRTGLVLQDLDLTRRWADSVWSNSLYNADPALLLCFVRASFYTVHHDRLNVIFEHYVTGCRTFPTSSRILTITTDESLAAVYALMLRWVNQNKDLAAAESLWHHGRTFAPQAKSRDLLKERLYTVLLRHSVPVRLESYVPIEWLDGLMDSEMWHSLANSFLQQSQLGTASRIITHYMPLYYITSPDDLLRKLESYRESPDKLDSEVSIRQSS
ncbi:hypothetical protein IWQ62_000801 [Dispira parvispora]|uniref:Pentatricopeptide repeat-containing protein n=1 Tax=Dispira parvispora TaxID=1520584 RepID=A0A9W8AZF4_9FUNG|nr:hypothetical protein IWQ62_000801 [Dispira parvispora]